MDRRQLYIGYVKYQTGTTSCVVFAAFGNFYIEISMYGYTTGDAALSDAREFLGIYKQKTSRNPDNEVSVSVRVERRSNENRGDEA